MSEPALTPIEIGLTAAIVTVEQDEPSILVAGDRGAPPDNGEPRAGLPFGPFDPVAHRTFESGLRAWVAAQTALTTAIRAEQDSVARMVNRLEWVRRQLQDLAGQVRGDSTIARDSAARRIGRLADSLDRKGQAIEAVLFDVHLTGAREDAFRNPTQLYERLAALQSDVAENSSDFAPTSQQTAVNDLFKQRIADVSARFADFMAKDVPAFSAELRGANLKDVIAAKIDGGLPREPGP